MKEKNINKIFSKIKKYYEIGTIENYNLNIFLLISSIFLSLIVVYELYCLFNNIEVAHFIHTIEIIFGFILLIELILSIVIAYLPNKIYFSPYLILNLFVVITLLFPQILGNVAFLKIIKSVKLIKTYLLRKKTKEQKEKHNIVNKKELRRIEKLNKKNGVINLDF